MRATNKSKRRSSDAAMRVERERETEREGVGVAACLPEWAGTTREGGRKEGHQGYVACWLASLFPFGSLGVGNGQR